MIRYWISCSIAELLSISRLTLNLKPGRLEREYWCEIKYLQERSIPVTHDLAGYVVRGLIGCANPNPLDPQAAKPTPAVDNLSKHSSSEEEQIIADICKPAHQLKEEVMEQINVLLQYQMPVLNFLAGWFR